MEGESRLSLCDKIGIAVGGAGLAGITIAETAKDLGPLMGLDMEFVNHYYGGAMAASFAMVMLASAAAFYSLRTGSRPPESEYSHK